MKTRLPVGPEISYAGHHHREQRRQQLLQIIADEKVFLLWFAYDSGRIDGVASMKDSVDVKDGIVMPERVVTVVIAKRSLWFSLLRWRVTYQRKLRLGCQ